MNYLAHLLLSSHTPESLIGGLLGDFVKGSLTNRYSQNIAHGIQLHRAIDRYTDDHVIVRSSRALISAERRRYAGIMIDVFYDHFLARHWSSYATVSLADFTQETYRVLALHQHSFPERLQHLLPHMTRDDWLTSYREHWAVDAALNGISRRMRRPNRLAGAACELEAHYQQLEAQFLEYFPQLVHHVMEKRAILSSDPARWQVRDAHMFAPGISGTNHD
ncbi:MAG: acyl carrier protein phosphodiesterase [Acidiferrobacterales bacterium]